MHETADGHIMERILEHNHEAAKHNREHFDKLGCCVFNLMSAPGAGKTTLLENILPTLSKEWSLSVIEGDMVGDLDAQRLENIGATVYQISTGRSCHLDAQMIGRLLHSKDLKNQDLIFIENVGNLVCPAEFPLGETKRVVLLSVTEGDDKPLKYPVIFRNCDAVIFTKCDLLPYVNFDMKKAQSYVANINAEAAIFAVSTSSQEGIADCLKWIEQARAQKQHSLQEGELDHVH